jgi:hypothetical protein
MNTKQESRMALRETALMHLIPFTFPGCQASITALIAGLKKAGKGRMTA